jgi:hypothetical protein
MRDVVATGGGNQRGSRTREGAISEVVKRQPSDAGRWKPTGNHAESLRSLPEGGM